MKIIENHQRCSITRLDDLMKGSHEGNGWKIISMLFLLRAHAIYIIDCLLSWLSPLHKVMNPSCVCCFKTHDPHAIHIIQSPTKKEKNIPELHHLNQFMPNIAQHCPTFLQVFQVMLNCRAVATAVWMAPGND